MDDSLKAFTDVFECSEPANADFIFTLSEINEWCIDNIGQIPSALSSNLEKAGFSPININGDLFWCIRTK